MSSNTFCWVLGASSTVCIAYSLKALTAMWWLLDIKLGYLDLGFMVYLH